MSATISIQPTVRARQVGLRPAAVPAGVGLRPAAVPAGVGLVRPVSVAPPRAMVSEATYRRRRAVVGIILAVLFAATVVLAHDVLAGSGGVPASAAASQPALVRQTITAQPGDTLWSIGQTYHGSVSIARYVDKLVDLNGGASIQAGQAVVLP